MLLAGTLEADAWVDVGQSLERKVAAVACHESRLGADPALVAEILEQRAVEEGARAGVGEPRASAASASPPDRAVRPLRGLWHHSAVRRRLLIVLAMSVALIGCGSQVRTTPSSSSPRRSSSCSPRRRPPPARRRLRHPHRLPPRRRHRRAAGARAPRAVPQCRRGPADHPAARLDTTLYEGDSLSVIDHGPGHLPWTALPGEVGNVSVAGHRVTHSHPFRHLDTLQLGDTLTFEVPSGSYTYEFTGHEIITPDRVDVTAQTPDYQATLLACHPPGSAKYRIVAHWKLVSAPAPGQPAS